MIYLDYNATSPLMPAVKKAMEALGDGPLNPASIHSAGRIAKKHLEDARALVASSLSAFPNEVLFVGSATEANNMVLRAFADRALLVSAVEHASVAKTASLLGGGIIPVDGDGVVKLDVLESMLKALNDEQQGVSLSPRERLGEGGIRVGVSEQTQSAEQAAPSPQPSPSGRGGAPIVAAPVKQRKALISVMLANNETGVIQPIQEIVAIAKKYDALVHSDAVQALGKITLDWGLLGVDMLTLCAHKAGGPVGAGALLIRNDLPIKPYLTGGKQELTRRAGTENLHAIVGLAQVVKETAHCPDAKQWLEWREWLIKEIQAACPDAQVMGAGADTQGVSLSLRERLGEGLTRAEVSGKQRIDERTDVSGRQRTTEQASPSPLATLDPLPNGEGAPVAPPRLPNTLNIVMPGVKSETQIMNFDLAGFAVSAGSACSSGRVAASATIIAMGVPAEKAECAIRVSWGWGTTKADIEKFAAAWKQIYLRIVRKAA